MSRKNTENEKIQIHNNFITVFSPLKVIKMINFIFNYDIKKKQNFKYKMFLTNHQK